MAAHAVLLGTIADPLTLNRYLYCAADPVNLIDPSGHLSRPTGYGKRVVPSTPASLQRQTPELRRYIAVQHGWAKNYIAGRAAASIAQLARKMVNANQQVQATRSAMIAASSGDAAGAAYYYAMAAKLREEYYQIHCVAADYMGYIPLEKPVFPDWVHNGLTIGGMIPVIGFAFDVIEAEIFLVEGNSAEASMSFIAAIPGLGDLAKGIKIGAEGFGFLLTGLRLNGKNVVIHAATNPFKHKYPSKLEKNMIDAGHEIPNHPYNAHHIVAKGSSKAEEARAVLDKYGIDIDDASNGAFLPVKKDTSDAAYHPSLHTDEYYRMINEELQAATSKDSALEILGSIQKRLLNGTFL